MTHDEMIEAVARAVEPELSRQEMVLTDPISLRRMMAERIARAAIRVVAPAVLEEAALVCDAEAVDCRNEWNRNLGVEDVMADVADDCAHEIRALKTRYEQ